MSNFKMYISDSIDKISNCIPIKTSNFIGEFDQNYQRIGVGKEQWDCNQLYEGRFLHDSLHGKGNYLEVTKEEVTCYEGLLYANNIEGYGRFSYPDCTIFEGLFKCNSRFGPGVFTYTNNTQDVGWWYGKSLIRLSQVVKPHYLPRIAKTPTAKIAILKFKQLIKVCNFKEETGKAILKSIDVNQEVLNRHQDLYNVYVRHPESLFFNNELYDRRFFCRKDCYIEVLDVLDEEISSYTSKVVTEVSKSESLIKEDTDDECICYAPVESRLQKFKRQLQEVEYNISKTLAKINYLKCKLKHIKFNTSNRNSSEGDDTEEMEEPTPEMNSDMLGEDYLDESLECESNYDVTELDFVNLNNLLDIMMNEKQTLLIEKGCLMHKISYEKYFEDKGIKEETHNKQVLVTDLLAFNNGKLFIELLKHIFLHRRFESNMTYCVADVFSGSRTKFKPSGIYESDCISFLSECSNGSVVDMVELLLKHDINPDICDARGNTGIMFAVVHDNLDIIQALVNFGANLDFYNDECLTPLSLCILRVLAVIHQVTNWEEAFLTSTLTEIDEELEIQNWRPNVSLVSIGSIVSPNINTVKSTDLDRTIAEPQQSDAHAQKYLFNTDCIRPPAQKKKKSDKIKSGKKSSTKKKASKKDDVDKEKEDSEKQLRDNQLMTIFNTIDFLLKCGANPNNGNVPMPILILAIFINHIGLVKCLLENNANPNLTTIDEELTPLHIITSLPYHENLVEIMSLLFQYSANPNCKTNIYHWINEKNILLANRKLIEGDAGKTPLHILCMRYDFNLDPCNALCQMAIMLILNGASVDDYYLGHTPLTLAMIRGSINLIKALLETSKVNPNNLLGEDMGVPLTVLALKRYDKVMPIATCQEIIQILLKYNANPFNTTGKRGNVIDFLYKEHNLDKQKKKKNSKPDKKSQKNGKLSYLSQIQADLMDAAKDVLERHSKGWLVTSLYKFVKKENYYDSIAKYMARRVTIEDVLNIGQLMIDSGKIPVTEETYEALYDLVEFIINANSDASEDDIPASTFIDIKQILKGFVFQRRYKPASFLDLPELEKHTEKFKVCSQCLRSKDVELVLCPRCRSVYFCSQECNILNNKQKKPTHRCYIVFYKSEKRARAVDAEEWQYARIIEPNPKRRLHLRRKNLLESKTIKGRHIKSPNQSIDKDFDTKGTGKLKKYNEVSTKKRNVKEIYDKLEKQDKMSTKKRTGKEMNDKLEKQDKMSTNKRTGKEMNDKFEKRDKMSTKKGTIKELNDRWKKMDGKQNKVFDGDLRRNSKDVSAKYAFNKVQEFQQRLPLKYQRFLEKLSRYWPEFDLSQLFLPYACFSDGQLYYKFVSDQPLFMETYSLV